MSKKLTTKDFIEKAKSIHGDRYDYDKTCYINSITKVKIFCISCNKIFEQKPNHHLSGCGCRTCAIIGKSDKNRFNTDIFIEKAKEIHGDKYDYSRVNYINSNTHIEIICKIHESFFQLAGSHLNGAGCRLCNGGHQLTTAEFVNKAKEVHGDLYDYSIVEYKSSRSKINIICKIHGEFHQTANSHLSGVGCPECGKCRTKDKQRFNTDIFIERAVEIYGNRYDYSLVDYTGIFDTVKIICKEHGIFNQDANNHINKKRGCPKCSGRNRTTEDIIKMFREIHGDLYDYSKVNYTRMTDKVNIICRKHGIFKIDPHHHISQKNGCPKCNSSKGELSIIKYLDANKITYETQKRFIDCKNIKPLPFDFYLPDYNTCIEFDGEQHYLFDKCHWNYKKPKKFKMEQQKLTKLRDKIKSAYCLDKQINLIRIHYLDIEKIAEILDARIFNRYKSLENLF